MSALEDLAEKQFQFFLEILPENAVFPVFNFQTGSDII